MLAFSFPVITVYKVGLELPNPFSLAKLLRPFNSTFWNFLSRNFQGCCLLFNYQGSLLLFLATAILDYHISHRLSTTFLIFFLQSVITFLCRKLCRIPATFIDIITFFFQSQPLFLLFCHFFHPTCYCSHLRRSQQRMCTSGQRMTFVWIAEMMGIYYNKEVQIWRDM